ncbi:hypothetical protein G5714_024698 [Onychostoma macrolepis]|uniref:Uncharacterized protein n=1 Tax=Onychostoma macrolepis TaxID=369639 RepID=A0A7J6BJ17_9TELE|nr:hypothetical protein G5714_024698 [Onychostoma macrolepis]
MEPRRNSSETPEPSQTCGGLDSLPRAGFCGGYRATINADSTHSMRPQHLDFCNTPNWDVQSEGHRVMAHQFEAPRMQEWSH